MTLNFINCVGAMVHTHIHIRTHTQKYSIKNTKFVRLEVCAVGTQGL